MLPRELASEDKMLAECQAGHAGISPDVASSLRIHARVRERWSSMPEDEHECRRDPRGLMLCEIWQWYAADTSYEKHAVVFVTAFCGNAFHVFGWLHTFSTSSVSPKISAFIGKIIRRFHPPNGLVVCAYAPASEWPGDYETTWTLLRSQHNLRLCVAGDYGLVTTLAHEVQQFQDLKPGETRARSVVVPSVYGNADFEAEFKSDLHHALLSSFGVVCDASCYNDMPEGLCYSDSPENPYELHRMTRAVPKLRPPRRKGVPGEKALEVRNIAIVRATLMYARVVEQDRGVFVFAWHEAKANRELPPLAFLPEPIVKLVCALLET